MHKPRIILASQSKARRRLLEAAGIEFTAQSAGIDEQIIRETLVGPDPMPAADVALILAEAKAASISEKFPGDLVIGADQVLEFEDRILTKAKSPEAARNVLIQLRGKTHRLISAVVGVRAGTTLWRHTEEAHLEMRDFSNQFLGQYIAAMKASVTQTVGGYEIEGRGIQLFSKVSGDLFTIQGLPLLQLLAFLRRERAIE